MHRNLLPWNNADVVSGLCYFAAGTTLFKQCQITWSWIIPVIDPLRSSARSCFFVGDIETCQGHLRNVSVSCRGGNGDVLYRNHCPWGLANHSPSGHVSGADYWGVPS
ncbi:hypothetical protein Bbelb_355880 [Branchiostoma belcheri]|nr:hypothetical protein Bbelb_355880 [Branchiostoma belcheri]